jgi:hypothetical protein
LLALTGHCFSSSACLKQGCHRGVLAVIASFTVIWALTAHGRDISEV